MPITPEDFSEANLAAWLAAGGAPFDVDITSATTSPDPPEYAVAASTFIQGAWPRLKSGIRVLDKTTTDLQISPTSLTDIYNYAIPGGTLAAGDIVRVTWNGHYFNNDGGTRNATFSVSFGGVQLWSDLSVSLAVSTNRRPIKIVIDITVVSTTLHHVTGFVQIGNITAASVGVGDIATNAQITSSFEGIDSTVDTASTRALQLQCGLSTVSSAATHYIRRRSAYVEML